MIRSGGGDCDGLACLLAEPDRREHLRQLGLAQAQRYSWERTARETAVVYEKVLNGNHRASFLFGLFAFF
ncbi:MAG: hypothetical protein H6656_17405 [Ardenticatenaceae bacterium]|nr:hypothetical protein [Ardenticatenaceae bacterium]